MSICSCGWSSNWKSWEIMGRDPKSPPKDKKLQFIGRKSMIRRSISTPSFVASPLGTPKIPPNIGLSSTRKTFSNGKTPQPPYSGDLQWPPPNNPGVSLLSGVSAKPDLIPVLATNQDARGTLWFRPRKLQRHSKFRLLLPGEGFQTCSPTSNSEQYAPLPHNRWSFFETKLFWGRSLLGTNFSKVPPGAIPAPSPLGAFSALVTVCLSPTQNFLRSSNLGIAQSLLPTTYWSHTQKS